MPTGGAKGRMRSPWDRKLRVLGRGRWPLPRTEGHFGEARKQKIRKQPGKASKCAVGVWMDTFKTREKCWVTIAQHRAHRAKREAEAEPHRHPAWHSGLRSCDCALVTGLIAFLHRSERSLKAEASLFNFTSPLPMREGRTEGKILGN